MKKITISLLAVLTLSMASALAQDKFSPKPGSFSFGLTFNPMAASLGYQPKEGDFAKDFIGTTGADPKSMFFLAKEPMASLLMKYKMSTSTSLRFNLGFNGSQINYKEYVDDQLKLKDDPSCGAKTYDVIHNKLNSFSLGLALEFAKPVGAFQFNAGVGLLYAIGGGSMSFEYGNPLTEDLNWVRTTIPMLAYNADPKASLNQFPAANNVGVTNGYPVERYNVGYNQGLGLSFDMGIEWFAFDHVSVGLAMTVTPVMVVFQPQTWTMFEGYSTMTGNIYRYNDLVSPGSTAILYGLETLGFRLSLNYYL